MDEGASTEDDAPVLLDADASPEDGAPPDDAPGADDAAVMEDVLPAAEDAVPALLDTANDEDAGAGAELLPTTLDAWNDEDAAGADDACAWEEARPLLTPCEEVVPPLDEPPPVCPSSSSDVVGQPTVMARARTQSRRAR